MPSSAVVSPPLAGLPPPLLPALYAALVLTPLGLAWAQGLPPRPWRDELASALALLGFAMLLVEFVLSGRFRSVSGRIGIDVTMRAHQLLARILLAGLILHPFLYGLPLNRPLVFDPTRAQTLHLPPGGLATGLVAWIGLVLLIVTAIRRDELPFRYEAWRLSHGLGAVLIAAAGVHHTLHVGRYAADPLSARLWLVLLLLALATLGWVYLVKPLQAARRPWRLIAVTPCAERTNEVVIEPADGRGLVFRAGQFVWLKLDHGPFGLREHPLSIASAPAERPPRLRFVVKEAGDFTRTIRRLRPGARAFVDGPHGALVVAGRPAPGRVLLAGGAGIAPMLSILREAALAGERTPTILLYANRHAGQIVAGAELLALRARMPLTLHHLLAEPPPGWTGSVGRIDRDSLRRLVPAEALAGWLFVLCGPNPMIRAVEPALLGLGVDPARILAEKFAYD
jgi:predicted ferric reductase